MISEEETIISKKVDRNVFSKITTISKTISSPYATLPRKFNNNNNNNLGQSPFVEVPNPTFAIEYKKGYIRRKCCYDSNGRKSKSNCNWLDIGNSILNFRFCFCFFFSSFTGET